MRKVGLLVLPGFQVLGFSALSAFEVANKEAGERLYDLRIISEHGGQVSSSLGMQVTTEPFGETPFDTILIAVGMEVPETPLSVSAFLRQAVTTTRRLASICLGSFVLGDAGLLDGRRATTHWLFAQQLRTLFPRCRLDIDRIYIEDGPIWTSAGMSAATDLAIGMIERDQGSELARMVARGMVMHHRRAGGQSQHSALLDLDSPNDRVQTALAYAKRNLRKPLDLDDLAAAACLSRRQFTRLFRAETGTTPARAVEALRLEAAQFMLDQSRLPVEAIARETGFGNRERMRRAFVRGRGEAPRSIRSDAGPLATMKSSEP
jgi:transcriptional regulator GlxA family with amidase domain